MNDISDKAGNRQQAISLALKAANMLGLNTTAMFPKISKTLEFEE